MKTSMKAAFLAAALMLAAAPASAGSYYGDGPVGDYPDWAQRVLFDTSGR